MLSGQAITRLPSSTPSSLKIQFDQFFHRVIKGYIITTSLSLLIGPIGFEDFFRHLNIQDTSRHLLNIQDTSRKPSDLLILISSQGTFSTSRILPGELLILGSYFISEYLPNIQNSFSHFILQYPYNIQDISNSEYSKFFWLCSH
ncbi:hypothetical protein BU17DRAFT_72438 [Hysterangium stoloniferum]|nr:hypothetical protein BU17DRAFT_72438 [Hysterangium stoloniferum]